MSGIKYENMKSTNDKKEHRIKAAVSQWIAKNYKGWNPEKIKVSRRFLGIRISRDAQFIDEAGDWESVLYALLIDLSGLKVKVNTTKHGYWFKVLGKMPDDLAVMLDQAGINDDD